MTQPSIGVASALPKEDTTVQKQPKEASRLSCCGRIMSWFCEDQADSGTQKNVKINTWKVTACAIMSAATWLMYQLWQKPTCSEISLMYPDCNLICCFDDSNDHKDLGACYRRGAELDRSTVENILNKI